MSTDANAAAVPIEDVRNRIVQLCSHLKENVKYRSKRLSVVRTIPQLKLDTDKEVPRVEGLVVTDDVIYLTDSENKCIKQIDRRNGNNEMEVRVVCSAEEKLWGLALTRNGQFLLTTNGIDKLYVFRKTETGATFTSCLEIPRTSNEPSYSWIFEHNSGDVIVFFGGNSKLYRFRFNEEVNAYTYSDPCIIELNLSGTPNGISYCAYLDCFAITYPGKKELEIVKIENRTATLLFTKSFNHQVFGGFTNFGLLYVWQKSSVFLTHIDENDIPGRIGPSASQDLRFFYHGVGNEIYYSRWSQSGESGIGNLPRTLSVTFQQTYGLDDENASSREAFKICEVEYEFDETIDQESSVCDCTWETGSLFVIRGKDKGRPAWHLVKVRNELQQALKAQPNRANIDVKDYGEIVASEWGDNPVYTAVPRFEDKQIRFHDTTKVKVLENEETTLSGNRVLPMSEGGFDESTPSRNLSDSNISTT